VSVVQSTQLTTMSMISTALRPQLQQTMLRIKDPRLSIPFYEKNFGMKLVHWAAFPQWKFTVAALAHTLPKSERNDPSPY